MSSLLLWFATAAVTIGALAGIAIWAPRARALKIAALACATLLLPIVYFTMDDLLSRPKAIELTAAAAYLEDARVVSSMIEENVAIYLWLKIADSEAPRSFQLPWSKQTAIELHKAQQQAEAKGTQVKMKKPGEASMDDQEPVFYAAAPPPPPPKQQSNDSPMVVQAAKE